MSDKVGYNKDLLPGDRNSLEYNRECEARAPKKSLERYHEARQKHYNDPMWRVRLVLRNSRARSKTKGLSFNLDLEYVVALWKSQDNLCAVTGVEFELDLPEGRTKTRPNAPSLDRIDPDLGYVKGNVRFVTYQANCAMLNFGEQALIQMARNIMINNGEMPYV